MRFRPPRRGTRRLRILRTLGYRRSAVRRRSNAAAKDGGAIDVDLAWGKLSHLCLKRWLKQKGLSKELVDSALGAKSKEHRAAVVAFAKAIDAGDAGIAQIESLAQSLGLPDPWRSTQAHLQLTKPLPPSKRAACTSMAPAPVEQGKVFEFFEMWEPTDGY
eukprot:TRINITY_DN41833_c0_g1_i1.p1 TRINITY_DN41833_c0_g1~~TRINITY_DN41833_c0_g1_i1.p1  ORF type:complete len:173 (-),score=20.98 TRINITY_DN41833_c0_g1_i1:159-641(-)